MIRLALTGSIGMGKSTTADMFAEEGVPVWDADAAVARLYGPGGAAVAPLAEVAPEAAGDDAIDRDALRRAVADRPEILPRIEAIVHPLVAKDRERFLTENADAPVTLCDIPLLFETGGADAFDAVVVVSAPEEVQRARVLKRPEMTEKLFDAIRAKQTTDAEKRARADFIVDTSKGKDAARDRVREILDKISNGQMTERA